VRRRKAPTEAFLFLPVKLPRLIEEQNKITIFLELCDKEIDLYSKKLELLRKQKVGLMQRLLTGQVRVKL
jgi:type I restriction enzyme S subunit